jgi:hypothetical protein
MCVACVEYIRDRLTTDELKNALRETSAGDLAHREEVDRLIRELAGKPEELRKRLSEISKS